MLGYGVVMVNATVHLYLRTEGWKTLDRDRDRDRDFVTHLMKIAVHLWAKDQPIISFHSQH